MARKLPRSTKPFDVTFKHLVEARPKDLLAYAGITDVPAAKVIDPDLSTVMSEADKVVQVQAIAGEYLVHLEFQSSADSQIVPRLVSYNALLYRRYGLPAWSIVFLLRRSADAPGLNGLVEVRVPGGPLCFGFHYQVVRVWEKPLASVLAGPLGSLPLAPLCDEASERLPDVIREMDQRLREQAEPHERKMLWAASYFLMGLRYDRQLAARLIQGVQGMKDSVTYQATLEEGRIEGAVQEAKKMLLDQGREQFGAPTARIREKLTNISDVEHLERLGIALLRVSSWEELLGEPAPARRRKHRKSKP